MIANPFDNRCSSRIAYRETLTNLSCGVEFATGRPVEQRIASNYILVRGEARLRIGSYHDSTTSHTLADIVIRFTSEQ